MNLQEDNVMYRRAKGILAQSVLLISMPAAWLRSLWASRELLDGRYPIDARETVTGPQSSPASMSIAISTMR